MLSMEGAKKMKKLRLRENVQNIIGVALFYLVLIGGVFLIDARYDQLCENGHTQYCDVEGN